MKRGLSWYATLGLVVLFLGGALRFQDHMIRRFYLDPEKYRDSLYVPSPGYLRVITLGYDQFFADFFWLRMIQGFAAGWSREGNAEQMYTYFEGITELDPLFLEVYSFSFMPLGEEGHRDDLVKNVVMKSYISIPGNWKITSDGASYFGLTQVRDAELAKFYLRLALLSPEHPQYIENWTAYFDFKEGRFEAAYEKYMTDYIRSMANGINELTDVRRLHLMRNVDAWYKDIISAAVDEWEQKTPGPLPTLEQLRASGSLRGKRLPDWTAIRLFMDALERAGRIERASDEEVHRQIGRFIKTWDEFPSETPYDYLTPGYRGFAIIPSARGREIFSILNMQELLRHYQNWMAAYDAGLQNYKAAHDGKAPADPSEIVPDMKDFKDPLGGEFKIDPQTGALSATSVPDVRNMDLKRDF